MEEPGRLISSGAQGVDDFTNDERKTMLVSCRCFQDIYAKDLSMSTILLWLSQVEHQRQDF